MPEDIINRIKLLVELSGMSVNAYARVIRVYPQTLYKCINGRVPAVELLQSILTAFPEISAEWLLMGTGEMKKQNLDLIAEQMRVKDRQIDRLINKIK